MTTTARLLLATQCFVLLTLRGTSLRPGGRNVKTRWVSYSTRLSTAVTTLTSSRTCTKTWTWSCQNCRRCRTTYRQKWKNIHYYVTRYKPIYYCAHGWRAAGDECTIPICTGQPACANGGTCISPERCRCMPGWRGAKCRTNINECLTNNGGCQQHCSNNRDGSYRCYCDQGYAKSGFFNCQVETLRYERDCLRKAREANLSHKDKNIEPLEMNKDINECQGGHSCQQNCVNKPGSYSCTCRTGYELDNNGRTCSDVNECAQAICQYKCNNTVGSFFCTCPQGYLLTTNKRDCADHDECTTGNHTCGQLCVNHPGAYACTCHIGYSLNNDNRSCSDVDECKTGLAGCQYQCRNTNGSFQCICPTGYFLNPDNRTCSDHNECKNGQHTCSQICGNTPGSYYCACRPGYYLDGDFRTCKGYPCSSLSQPVNGYINCTGNTVDSVCQFSCQPGYELVGSMLLTCLIQAQWNGVRPVCKIKQCKRPKPPSNGFVKIPCSTTYKGKCSFDCRSGYFLNGSKIVSCSADSTWIPTPGNCDAITVCRPNPCLNGGVCRPLNSTAFWCNCTGTAHIGSKCQVGIFRKPNYPRLEQNSSWNFTFQLSPPKDELTITFNSVGLELHPRDLVVVPVKLERGRLYIFNMTVTARLPGIHQITYTLSGATAKDYQAVLPDTVIVLQNGTSCNENANISFPKGCHKIALYKCPVGSSFLYAKSTEPWLRSTRRVSTNGAVSIVSGNLTLPLGLRGAALDKIDRFSVSRDTVQCYDKTPKNLECFPSETLATVFLQSLNSSLPSWLHLIPSKTFSNLEPNDVITYIWTGMELKGVLKGLGLSLKDHTYYSVLLYTGAITVVVNGTFVKLPKYGKNSFLLAAVELCLDDLPPNVVLAFNPLSYVTLRSMPLYQELATKGWNISVLAMQFFGQRKTSYLVNVWNRGNVFVPGNLELYGRVEKTIFGSHPIHFMKVSLVGNAVIGLQDNNNVWVKNQSSWTAGIRGQTNVSVALSVLKQQIIFNISLHRCSGKVRYQEYENYTSCKFQDTYEMSLNGLLQKDPFTSTLLGSFIEIPSSNVSLFAKSHNLNNSSSNSRSATHLELYILNGTIKFGPLKFPNVTIKTEIATNQTFERCSAERKAQDLKLSASFNQKAALGRFFTISQSDSVQIFLPFDSQNKTYGILNATVSLLGDSFESQVTISNTSASFKRDFLLFNTYRLSLSGSSRLQPWDYLLLKVTGVFGRSNKGGTNDALEDVLKKMINEYIQVVVEHTVQRLVALQNIDNKMSKRFEQSKTRLLRAENRTSLAITRYLWALKAQKAASKEASTAEKNVSVSNQEFNKLKASLERLCSVTECPHVCVAGTACNTCYKDLISEEQGLCPAICHNVLKKRVPPFKEMATCLEEECDHSGGDLLSFVSCNFEKVGKAVAKTVATGFLTSVGVPPQAAYPLANGIVRLAETGSVEEAAKSAAGADLFVTRYINKNKDIKMAKDANSEPNDNKNLDGKVLEGVVSGVVDAVTGCNDEGEWNCYVEPKPCEKDVFNYSFTEIPYSCEISCKVNVIKETVATPCCKVVNCASRIKELRCKEKNVFCLKTTEKALSKLNTAKSNLLKPFAKLQNAKRKLRIAEIELAKQKIELEGASSERNILRRVHDAVAKASKISQRANGENRALLKDAIVLARLWNSTNQTCPVDIKEVSFGVTFSSPRETSIPVMFKIASKDIEKTIFPILNFASLNDSLQQVTKQIVRELFGNVSFVLRSGHPLNQMSSAKSAERRRRTIDEGNADVTNLLEFKKKCALVTNYHRVLTDILSSLYKISAQSLMTFTFFTNQTITQRHAEARDFAVNMTQATEFGLTAKDVKESMKVVSSDLEVITAVSLIELRNAANHNKVQTAMGVVYREWEASMEWVFNGTSLECNGFVDCVEDFVDNWNYLYQDVNLPEAVRLKKTLAVLGTEVKALVSFEDLAVAEAAEKSSRILQILQDIKNEKILCAVAPNITNHPEAMKNMKTGQTLELTCKAAGDPAPSYRWKKNGVLLLESDAENLRIEKVTTKDSGNYTCEAYNHASVETSTPSLVLVHPPPTLVHQPPSKLHIPINTGFYLRCKATSLVRPLRYQWLFMPFEANGYSMVENGNFSVLKFTSVQNQEEGFYKCNVSNPFDFTLSHDVQVRVLGFSLVVPSLGLSFEIVGNYKSLQDSYEENNQMDIDNTPLHDNERFQLDVQFSFKRVVSNLANLSFNAVRNLTIHDCKSNDQKNVSCSVSLRLLGLNVTGPESTNRTERENARSVMESVNVMKQSVAVLVNESNTRGISLNVKDVSLYIDPSSWKTGEYKSICPTGMMLYVNNFLCVNCPSGTYGALNGTTTACFPCPLGTYQPHQGQTSCFLCPSGSNSRKTGLGTRSSCKEIVTYPTTFPPTETTLKESVATTATDETRSTRKDEVEKTTRSPNASGRGSDKDVANKWKIAFGACVAIIVILLAGVLAYAIRYRIKKISHSKTGKMRTTDQTFQNPIYDTNEDVKEGPVLSQENLIYQSGDPSAAKPGTLYSHENPCYQIEDPQDDDTSM